MTRRTAIWALAALLGIVLTAGITWATSQLTSQHIGLASEPLSAGNHLAPSVAAQTAPRRPSPVTTPTVRVLTVTVPASPAPSRSTQTAPVAPVESAPVAPVEQVPAPRTSTPPSGDDGHRGHAGGRDD